MAQRLLTISEAARRLSCSTDTVYRRIRSKAIPVLAEGGRWRIRESDLDEYIDSLPRSA